MKGKKITQTEMDLMLNGCCMIMTTGFEGMAAAGDIIRWMGKLAPMDEDGLRRIWIEVPRGSYTYWKETMRQFDPGRFAHETLMSWHWHHPYESTWYYLECWPAYGGADSPVLVIGDGTNTACRIEDSDEQSGDIPDFVIGLLSASVREKIDAIVADPLGYNIHISEHLPHCMRTGRIKRKDFNSICPGMRIFAGYTPQMCKGMRELARMSAIYKEAEYGGIIDWQSADIPYPLPQMTIRLYFKYWRMAHIAYYQGYYTDDDSVDDVEFYNRTHGYDDMYDLDSEADFARFAIDHYGEIRLTQVNLRAEHVSGGWFLKVFFIMEHTIENAAAIASALQSAGLPVCLEKAAKLLAIIEESDFVRIQPVICPDRRGLADDEGSCFCLPAREECGEDNDNISVEQYDLIVQSAQWDEQPKAQPLDKDGMKQPIDVES